MTEEEAIALRDAYRRRYPEVQIAWDNAVINAMFAVAIDTLRLDVEMVCGYDPQLLLADHRSALVKLCESWRIPDLSQFPGYRIPHLFPGTKLELLPYVDSPRRESEEEPTRAGLYIRTFPIQITVSKPSAKAMRLIEEALERYDTSIRAYREGFYATALGVPYEPRPWHTMIPDRVRERLIRLLRSDDPRQVKRGHRTLLRERRRWRGK